VKTASGIEAWPMNASCPHRIICRLMVAPSPMEMLIPRSTIWIGRIRIVDDEDQALGAVGDPGPRERRRDVLTLAGILRGDGRPV
jgi:hypothetical protein